MAPKSHSASLFCVASLRGPLAVPKGPEAQVKHFTVISFKEARDQIAIELGDHNITFYSACDEVALTVQDGVSLTEKLVADIISDWLMSDKWEAERRRE